MTDRLLASIIDLEKALHEEVCREEERAAAWQARELAALQAAVEQARRDLERQLVVRGETAQQEAVDEGEKLRQAATDRCERLSARPESVLQKLLLRELIKLLPEDEHDHPDGEG